jgi:sensor domain CHASE-containing protein
MTVRTQTLIVYCGTLAALVLILYLSSSTIVLRSFVRLEQTQLRGDLERVRSAVAERVGEVQRLALDWAVWDDTWRFAAGENPDYVRSNLDAPTITNLRLNLIAVVAPDGRLIDSIGFDIERSERVEPPAGTAQLLAANGPLFRLGLAGPAAGIVLLPDRTLLVAAHPILDSARRGPCRGVLVMGRFLDGPEVERLSHSLQVAFTAFRTDDPKLPADVAAVLPSLSGRSPDALRELSDATIAGYRLAADLAGAPAVLLRVERPRDVYQLGKADVRYLIATFLGGGVFFVILGMVVLSTVLSRMAPKRGAGRGPGATTKQTPPDRPSPSLPESPSAP